MRTVIIEDEAFAADALEALISRVIPTARVEARLESIEESLEWFEENPAPDLLFCDIHLSDGNSFEIFKNIELKCPVIFTTAYDQYAIEAFKVNSIDYLLKPVKEEDLKRAFDKYQHMQKDDVARELENIRSLLRQGPSVVRPEPKSRFMVKSGQSIKAIPQEEIAYFLAEEGVVLLVSFDKKRYIVNYTLEQLDEQLDPRSFFRANRGLIVNIKAVSRAEPYFKGRLLLQTEPPLPEDQVISSSKAAAFKDWLDL